MQEVHPALVAISGAAAAQGTGRPPRTSFVYSSQPAAMSPTHTGRIEMPVCASSPPVNPGTTTTSTTTASTTITSMAEVGAGSSRYGNMDASQLRAATFPIDRPLLLQAGAGSGKTQTMAARIVYLLESGVAAGSILGICFTRQAAETLRARVHITLPPHLRRSAHQLKLKTFHAFGLECLRRFGDVPPDVQVVDAQGQRKIARMVVMDKAKREKSREAVAALVDYVNHVKAMKVPPIAQSDPNVQDAFLFPHYERMLHDEMGGLDFGDLQQRFYLLIRPLPVDKEASTSTTGDASEVMRGSSGGDATPSSGAQEQPPSHRMRPSNVCTALRAQYTHIVVDEFQDFNEVQMELLAQLAGDVCRVTCVGDPNQCIYVWRGAMPEVFKVWARRFPQTTTLTLAMNYRSDGPIVEGANHVVKACQTPFYHRDDRAISLVRCRTEVDEVRAVPFVLEHVLRHRDKSLRYDDIAILCRSRRRVSLFCEALRRERIPVRELRSTATLDRLATMRAFGALVRLCVAPYSRESNADLRTVLVAAPQLRIAAATVRKFLHSVEAVCTERRETEARQIRQWRHTLEGDALAEVQETMAELVTRSGDGGLLQEWDPAVSLAPAAPGINPASYAFFTIVQELVFHNFSKELFPKLDVVKAAQKNLRKMVQLVLHTHEALGRSGCDVESVLKDMLREGGFDSDSTRAVTTRRLAGKGAAVRGKRPRGGTVEVMLEEEQGLDDGSEQAEFGSNSHRRSRTNHSGGIGTQLLQQCVAEHNTQHGYRTPSHTNTAARASGADLQVDDVLPPEEEAAVWEEERMNLSELVLDTLHNVQEAILEEAVQAVATEPDSLAAGEENSVSSAFHTRSLPGSSSGSGGGMGREGSSSRPCTRLQAQYPPAVVLRRVLDEFLTLLPSDSYGPLRPLSADIASMDNTAAHASQHPIATLSTATTQQPQWMGQVTVSTVHRAKGMEWPAVLLPGCWVGEFPVRPNPEERRIFYVAMSRAMRHLICFTADAEDDTPDQGSPLGTVKSPYEWQQTSQEHEMTPYLMAQSSKMELIVFDDMRLAYLREHGNI